MMRMTRLGVAGAVISVMALSACAGGSDDGPEASDPEEVANWEPEFVDGELQPLEDGFPSQPLSIVNNDEAGSPDGLYARTMQQALEDISPVSVEILDRPDVNFGTWSGLEFAGDEAGGDEGHYPVIASMSGSALDFLVEPLEDDLGITLDDMNPVIATEKIPFVVISRAGAEWSTWDEMIAYGKDHPGELRYVSLGVGSGLDVAMEFLLADAGIEVKKIPLEDPVEIITVVAAGEADFAMAPADPVVGQAKAGKVDVLLAVGDKAEEPWADADTTEELGYDLPLGSTRGFIVPPETPELHRLWLYELFKAASETDVYTTRIDETPGATQVLLDHDQVLEEVHTLIEIAEPIIRDLGLHVDDQ